MEKRPKKLVGQTHEAMRRKRYSTCTATVERCLKADVDRFLRTMRGFIVAYR